MTLKNGGIHPNTIIMPQTKAKIEGKFYPLTAEELTYLCQILTDAELKTLLYLKSLHPFTDSYKELDTSAIAELLNISRRSIQRFLKKFKELNLIEWEITKFKYKTLQVVTTAGSPKRQQDRQNDTGIAKATAGSPKRQQDRQQPTKPLPDKGSGSPQTIQTIQTLQTGGGENIFSNNSDVLNNEESSSGLTDLGSILNNTSVVQNQIEKEVRPDGTLSPVRNAHLEDNCSAACNTTKVEQLTPSKPECIQKEKLTIKNLTPELQAKLEDLNIPLDQAVKKAIASYHSSQIWGALAHVEECSNEIRSPRGVFLYQIPRQEIDRRKPREFFFTPEFKQWYQQAIAEGIVANRPIDELYLWNNHEPMIILPNGQEWRWTEIRDGKIPIEPTEEERKRGFDKEVLEKLKKNASSSSNGYKYLSTQEKAKLELERAKKSPQSAG